MPPELERQVDEVWNSFLEKISKKETASLRSKLGDDIDVFVPQIRELLLLRSNPALSFVLYNSAYASANRNAYVIMRKLGMPSDYFWKFEYWTKDRSLDTMKRVINRVFTSMMNMNREGVLDIYDIDVEKMRFSLSFRDCAECAGVNAASKICFYHAATFAGIIAALIGKDLDGFETKCHAGGDEACFFTIGKRTDPEVAAALKAYLESASIKTVMEERLEKCLSGEQLRPSGNLVNIGYYQLLIVNILISNPGLFAASSFEIGVQYGKMLAPVIARHYHSSDTGILGMYYRQLRQLNINLTSDEEGIQLVIAECAEIATMAHQPELLSFLFGELQGLVSELLKRELIYRGHAWEGNNLIITLEAVKKQG